MTDMADDGVRRLLDLEDLKRLKYRYFRLMDAQDWPRFEDLFTDDAEINFTVPGQAHPPDAETTPEGWARVDRSALVRWTKASSEGFTTLHLAHMPDIEFTGPDTATGTWSMTDFTRWDASGDPTWYRSYGGHIEDYLCTSAGWKICRSRFTRHDFDVMEPPGVEDPAGL